MIHTYTYDAHSEYYGAIRQGCSGLVLDMHIKLSYGTDGMGEAGGEGGMKEGKGK